MTRPLVTSLLLGTVCATLAFTTACGDQGGGNNTNGGTSGTGPGAGTGGAAPTAGKGSMTGGTGGPVNATLSVALLMYKRGFRFWDMGTGAAIAFVLFAVILVVSTVQLRLQREKA